MTAELVVVTAMTVCSASLPGSFHGLSPVRTATTSDEEDEMITTPSRVVPRYASAVVTTPKPTSPASAASRQNTPIGAET